MAPKRYEPLTIADRNDVFRRSFLFGKVFLTSGIQALRDQDKAHIIEAVQSFDDFNADNDPHGEHDFGKISIPHLPDVFWKIDYYDKTNPDHGSEDPNDPAKTLRVLTIMLADEY